MGDKTLYFDISEYTQNVHLMIHAS